MKCNQCEMASINGLPTHEAGCPNVPSAMCDSCNKVLRKLEVFSANDWDGLKYCRDCAGQQMEMETKNEGN